MTNLLAMLLAQNPPAPRSQGPGGSMMFVGLLVFMFVFFIVMSRSSRKGEEKKRKALLDSLSKNDRVLTQGGVIGTIVAIRDREVVLKVDESTNTKMTFLKDSVRQVITDPSDLSSKASSR